MPCWVSVATTQKPMSQKYFDDADALYNTGHYDKAIEKYNAAFALDPTCEAKSVIGKAWCTFSKGECKSAIALCDKAIELKYSSTDVYYIRGRCHYHNDSFALAVSDFALCKDDFYQAKSLLWTAICLVKSRRHLEALDNLVKAVTDFSVPEDYHKHFTHVLPSAVMEILDFLKSKSTGEDSKYPTTSLETMAAAPAASAATSTLSSPSTPTAAPSMTDHVKIATAKALYVLAWIHYNSEEFSIAGQLCKKAFKLIMISPQVNIPFARILQQKLNGCRSSITAVESKLIIAEEERQKNIQTTSRAFACKKYIFCVARV